MGRDRQQQHQGIYTAPMDHSYRATLAGDNGNKGSRRPGFAAPYVHAEPEPLPAPQEDAASRILAAAASNSAKV